MRKKRECLLTNDELKLVEIYRKLDSKGKKDLFIWADVCYEAMVKETAAKRFRIIQVERVEK